MKKNVNKTIPEKKYENTKIKTKNSKEEKELDNKNNKNKPNKINSIETNNNNQKNFAQKKILEKKITSTSNSFKPKKIEQKTKNEKKKKKNWNNNIQLANKILNDYFEKKSKILTENIKYSFEKIMNLNKNIFFQNLFNIKKQCNDLLILITQQNNLINNRGENNLEYFDYNKILIDFLENYTKKIENYNFENISLNNTLNNNSNNNDDEYFYRTTSNIKNLKNKSICLNLTETNPININKKENSISFEYPITRKRALSSRIEKRLNRSRRSSEEIDKRIREKIIFAERQKENMKKINIENSNKITEKIFEIKKKQKKEKKEKLKKIYSKLEKMNKIQQKFIQNKLEIVKNEHEKVNEINYLHQLEKENRENKILNKLNISIERRNKYLHDKINKIHQSKNYNSEDLKENFVNKLKNNSNNNTLDILEKKKFIKNRIEFLKKVFNEDFIWELFEADYFDLDELVNISSLTRFELVKLKLRKEKQIIDKLYQDKKNLKKTNNNNPTSKTNSSLYNETISNNNDYYDDDLLKSEDEEDNNLKRSNSFTVFNENDFLDVDYLFENSKKKRKKKNKKKAKKINVDDNNINNNNNNNNENSSVKYDENEERKLIRSFNSMSQTDLHNFKENNNNSYNNENKIKKLLVKNDDNGKYIQSTVIIAPEEINIENSSPKKDEIIEDNENNSLSNSYQKSSSKNNNIQNEENLNNNINNSNSKTENENNNSNEINNSNSQKNPNVKSTLFKNLIQATNLTKSSNQNNNNKTITINNSNIANILENNQITIRWCKICNMILPNDCDPNTHINKIEHQKIKKEYGLSIQEEANTIMIFKSIPGNINEELKNERINAIKTRVKKLKQKMNLKSIKHENFWSYKQDFPSVNKQRIIKLSFDIEKNIYPNINYDNLENLLKDLIKILEQKKVNDLNILRQQKVIQTLVDVLKKPAAAHKSEIKSLGKILELIIKILFLFSSVLENRNYMLVTNRISIIADLLLWVLNKPTKIPLGLSFLPDLIQILIIHIKHRIPFEALSMKEDLLEYLLLSNIIIKFKQKYYNLNGPIDLNAGFGSFPLVLLKSLAMFESLTMQININFLTKPVYKKQTKISENILYMFEYSELIGLVHLLYNLLLSNGPLKLKEKISVQSQKVITALLLSIKILNNICRIDLNLVQNNINIPLNSEQIQHVLIYILKYCQEYLDSSDVIKELLHEVLLLTSYLSLNNENFQNILDKGELTIIQLICNLPFTYFSDKNLKDILFPTLICMTYNNERNTKILSNEINLELIVMYLKEKISLEPIIEEENVSEVSSIINNEGDNINNPKINKESFFGTNEKIERATSVAYSTASSTKSCHDMVTGVSDFVTLSHRFPYELWEKAQEYYSHFGKP